MPGQYADPQFDFDRLTAAAALTPAVDGMYLTKVRCLGGTTWGTLSIQYDSAARAHFIAPSDGTRGFAEYDVSWQIKGTNIPAGSIGFNGGISVAELEYCTIPNPSGVQGKSIESFRAMRNARTDAGATTADITTTWDVSGSAPMWIHVGISASNGRIVLPAVGTFQRQIEAERRTELGKLVRAPVLAKANTLVVSHVTDGAATIQSVYYY